MRPEMSWRCRGTPSEAATGTAWRGLRVGGALSGYVVKDPPSYVPLDLFALVLKLRGRICYCDGTPSSRGAKVMNPNFLNESSFLKRVLISVCVSGTYLFGLVLY